MTNPTQAPTSLSMGPGVYSDVCTAGLDWSSGLERCGILFGMVDPETNIAYVAGCAELENTAADPAHSYTFDPDVQAKSWARVERWGYTVLGIWHTHPGGPEGPSATDLEYAQPWYLYPVLWPGLGHEVGLGVYALADNEAGYVTVPYEVTEEAPPMAEQLGQAAAFDRAMKVQGA